MASTPNRWVIAIAGVIVMLCLGTVYSWGIFTQSLVAGFNWSVQDATLPFELALLFLGFGAVFGGRWQDRVGPRTVTVVGAIIWGVGVLLAGLGTPTFGKLWLDIFFGVIGGFGNGMAYITPVAMVTKWFPDRRGLGSGLVVMGFGLGAFVYNQIIPRIASFKGAAGAAAALLKAKDAAIKAGTTFDPTNLSLTPEQIHAVMMVFVVSGIVFAIIGGLCALVMDNPPANYSVGGFTAAAGAASGYTPSQALRTPQFYGLWILLFLNVLGGVAIISNAVAVYSELTKLGPAIIAPVFGLVALFNGLGRIFWGAVSDRLGRTMTYTVMYAIQAVTFFVMLNLHDLVSVGIAFAIVLLCYGGGFGVMPSLNADFFGTKSLGQNYGMILTAWGVAGFVGPFIAARIKDATGSFSGAILPIAIILVVAAIIPFFVKKPPSDAPVLSH